MQRERLKVEKARTGMLRKSPTAKDSSTSSTQIAPIHDDVNINDLGKEFDFLSDGGSYDLSLMDKLLYHTENRMSRSEWQKFYILLYVVIVIWLLFTVMWKYTSYGDGALRERAAAVPVVGAAAEVGARILRSAGQTVASHATGEELSEDEESGNVCFF